MPLWSVGCNLLMFILFQSKKHTWHKLKINYSNHIRVDFFFNFKRWLMSIFNLVYSVVGSINTFKFNLLNTILEILSKRCRIRMHSFNACSSLFFSSNKWNQQLWHSRDQMLQPGYWCWKNSTTIRRLQSCHLNKS